MKQKLFASGCVFAAIIGLVSGPNGWSGLQQPDMNWACWICIGLVAYFHDER